MASNLYMLVIGHVSDVCNTTLQNTLFTRRESLVEI